MTQTYISDISKHLGEEITIKGWLYNKRSSGKLGFLEVRDGSGIIQGVVSKKEVSEEAWANTEKVTQESSIIITGTPREHPLLASDPMLTVCEPYALWAIREDPRAGRFLEHPAITWTSDVTPYFLRKERLLNGAHTALLIKAWPLGFRTVREAVEDAELGAWLYRLLFEEIVPVLEGRVENPGGFATEVLDRFRNPFIEHKLADIAAYHATKVAVRLVPTKQEYEAKFGRSPELLTEVLGMAAPVV